MTKQPDQWFDLGRDLRVCFGPSTRKHGVTQPRRFIVLGPKPLDPNGYMKGVRPTRCAGAWIDGRAVIDFGMLGPALLRELETKLRERTR